MNSTRAFKDGIAAFAVAAALAAPIAAHAAGWVPDGVFAEAGFAPSRSRSVTAGAFWQWDWHGTIGNTHATIATEGFLSRWRARDDTVTQAALVPLLRLRLDAGRSPWFMEGGIGVSLMDDLYRNHGKRFSTRFNFVDVFAVARTVDANPRIAATSAGSVRSTPPWITASSTTPAAAHR